MLACGDIRSGALASRSCALYAILAFAANDNILIWRVKERKASSMFVGNRSRAKVACPRRVGCSSIMPGFQNDRNSPSASLLQSELWTPTMPLDSWAYSQGRTKRKACRIKRSMKPPTDGKERPREQTSCQPHFDLRPHPVLEQRRFTQYARTNNTDN
jgi:hypothetical protein